MPTFAQSELPALPRAHDLLQKGSKGSRNHFQQLNYYLTFTKKTTKQSGTTPPFPCYSS